MPRPRTPAGELGSIQLTTLANGRIRARLHMRDDAGAPHHPQATGATEAEAIANVRRRAAELSTGASEEMCADTTVAQACSVWLAEVRAAGRIEVSSVEAYEDTVRRVVVPTCGPIRVGELTVGRCTQLVSHYEMPRSKAPLESLDRCIRRLVLRLLEAGDVVLGALRVVLSSDATVDTVDAGLVERGTGAARRVAWSVGFEVLAGLAGLPGAWGIGGKRWPCNWENAQRHCRNE